MTTSAGKLWPVLRITDRPSAPKPFTWAEGKSWISPRLAAAKKPLGRYVPASVVRTLQNSDWVIRSGESWGSSSTSN